MGWEQRGNSHYFYTKERVDGRVVSTYHGHGEHGLLVASFQHHYANDRQATVMERQCERAQVERDDALWNAIAEHCKELATMILLAGGYHQHKGEWRKRRMAKTTALAPLPPRPEPGDTSREALRALMVRCNMQGAAKEDIAALRELATTAHPHIARLGDILLLALDSVTKGEGLHNATGLTIATAEANIMHRKQALGYDTSGPLEQPLIVHLVLCEQRLGITELLYAQQMNRELSIKLADYWERRLSQMQQRYLKAVETLAKVRRVRVEAWQANGEQAVGVAVERLG